ncbi:MAG: hypothetical protein AAGI07_14690, partial [Bacteroidota bacterium]
LIAQTTEEVIQSIRDRYYRINGASVNLTKVSLQGTDYYLENDKLSIAKEKIQSGKYEYYYDSQNGDYHPYFIYFEPTDPSTAQLRAYYNDNTELVLFKEGEVATTYGLYENYPYKYLKQDAYNAVNLYFNTQVLSDYPNDGRKDSILVEVARINESIVKTDTIDFYEEDGGSGGTFRYLNEKQISVKVSIFEGGEHFGSIKNEYYSKGQLIYAIHEQESWVGFFSRITVTVKFHEKGKPFREEYFDREAPEKFIQCRTITIILSGTNSMMLSQELKLESEVG